MPRVTININARNNEASDQDLLTLDLPPGLTVKDLKGYLEAETSFPVATQTVYLNGRVLSSEVQTLEQAGVKDGEMLAVLIRQGQPQRQTPPANRNPGMGNTPSRRPQRTDPEMVRLHTLNNPAAQASMRDSSPTLFAALQDPARWREEFEKMQQQQDEAALEHQRQIAILNEDPFNVDAQRKIEEIIRQDRVQDNLQHAIDNTPEVFARVHMLYIDTEVNGHPVKAFVDSGAQATIMSPSCAERCGIMRLIDRRYAGIAKGVGTATILGRVHHADIKVGDAIMPCAFTVMEGKDVDLLFGLDMLKRYKAKIDLDKNALCFEGIQVPFLAEHEIPKYLEDAELNEPTVAGPNGTEIGGRTGAVRQAGGTEAGPSSATGSQAAQEPAQPPKSAAEGFPTEHIDYLIDLGFTRQHAIQALQATGGNMDEAANLLLESMR